MTEEKGSSVLDALTKVVSLVSLVIALLASWKALQQDPEIKRLQTETQRLDNALKQADAQLKNLESTRRVTLELYQEVKNVIQRKDKDQREEEALLILVEALADDPFRSKLLKVMAAGAKNEGVKTSAAKSSRFYDEESVVQTGFAPAAAAGRAANGSAFGDFNVDVFYCEAKQASSKTLAEKALQVRKPADTGRWRVRLLPESINQQPGYAVKTNEIRFTPPEERPVADALAQALAGQGIPVQLHATSYPTPGYVSVFICQ